MTTRTETGLRIRKICGIGEVGPPKGTNIDEMLQHIDLLKDKV